MKIIISVSQQAEGYTLQMIQLKSITFKSDEDYFQFVIYSSSLKIHRSSTKDVQ